MAERRRHKKRIQEVSEPTKEEKAVAKYLRFNCPTKSTNMMGHRVDYFIASKAVDCLLDSKWAKAKKGEEALFTTRESVVDYCNRLLKKQFFHRALKVMKKKPEKDAKKEKEKEKVKSDSSKEEEKKGKKEKEKKKESEVAETKKEKSDESPGTPKKKKEVKKKFKLEPHEDQLFLDGNEVYVWIYDPVHFKTFAMGLILVIAVIAATLFPLWPAEMRVGVYYLSVAAGCFVASILLLAVARCILFLIIWLVTGGRHHFWFLPNLTADVGFIDSFRPLYTHEYKGPRSSDKKGSDKTDEKDGAASLKAQKSDSDEKSDSEKKDDEEEDEDEESKEAKGDATEDRHSDTDSDRREDEGSQHSNGNDFEMITREELEQHTEEEDDEEEEEENEEEGEEEDEETQERKEGSESKVQTAET
ncbi:translocation protein SEC62 [Poecilia latipinna]|uniref:Translocation protein SEC62 n=2 Tax=Poecilia TaxID=8080 RepID=A0A087XIS2_POEFO|nr:PREDICTED: translocation protein SEC62 [Poecilia formosa]XP_014887470.1 PREDICTED: translocation protein SEC62 [Poecilia latipinna]